VVPLSLLVSSMMKVMEIWMIQIQCKHQNLHAITGEKGNLKNDKAYNDPSSEDNIPPSSNLGRQQ